MLSSGSWRRSMRYVGFGLLIFLMFYLDTAEIMALENKMEDLVIDCYRNFHMEYHCIFLRQVSSSHIPLRIASHTEWRWKARKPVLWFHLDIYFFCYKCPVYPVWCSIFMDDMNGRGQVNCVLSGITERLFQSHATQNMTLNKPEK